MPFGFFIKSDTLLRVAVGKLNKTDQWPAAITTATARILTTAGAAVSDSTHNLTVDASNSRLYWGEFDDGLALTNGQEYDLEVTIVADTKKTTFRKRGTAFYYGST